MIRIERYDPIQVQGWNNFMSHAMNNHIMFFRDYMDYHADRFPDHSLMFYEEKNLICVLPASICNNSLVSHPGLTFGGLIYLKKISLLKTMEIVNMIKEYCTEKRLESLIYKAIPWIYFPFPGQEDIFALTFNGASLIRRDVSFTIDHNRNPTLSKGRKSSIKKAGTHNINISESTEYEIFMKIMSDILSERHNTKPVHTAQEIKYLSWKFPDNIKLFLAKVEEETIAGVITYETKYVVHSQYIGATELGKTVGALDVLLNYLIYDKFRNKRFFDFGISTYSNGEKLNQGLVINKETYGACAIVHDFYKLTF
jgi:hypothetical protein